MHQSLFGKNISFKTWLERKEINNVIEYIKEIAPCPYIGIEYQGQNVFDSILNLTYRCDWISYFLAKELVVDPLEVKVIEELKKRIN